MPILKVATNLEKSKIKPEIKVRLAELLAKLLAKPIEYVAVHIVAGEEIYFGGSDAPAAICTLCSIGALGIEQNKKYSKEMMALFKSELGLETDRVYIEFRDLNKANVGYYSTTFHELL